MRLSELIETLQATLTEHGDTEEVALCFVIETKPAHRLDVFGLVSVLHDTAEYPNGMAYLIADCNLQPSRLTESKPSNAERKIAHKLSEKMAVDRAHRIASVAAEELIHSEGEATSGIDEFAIPQCQADEHMRDCIGHLCWFGEAVSHETDDGYIVVQLGDFTLS